MSTDTITPAPVRELAAVTRLKNELALIEEKVVTEYTIADAIREGASVTGQKRNGWIEGDNACGLGAAYIAAQARGYVH